MSLMYKSIEYHFSRAPRKLSNITYGMLKVKLYVYIHVSQYCTYVRIPLRRLSARSA